MKFRRNVKEEKLFRWVAIGGLVLLAILFVIFVTTRDNALLDLIVPAILIPPLFFFISISMKKQFVEFKEDKIILINGNGRDITIDISEIETIMIPSATALQSKIQDNPIILKRRVIKNIISYSIDIEEYIKKNLKIDIVYYDKYSRAIK
jgi:hypothetical protein